MADNYSTEDTADKNKKSEYLRFPTSSDKTRLSAYDYNEKLFLGNHYEAFNIKIDSEQYSKAYRQLRYVMVNFAGLTSKVIADFLLSEPIKVKAPDGDQKFIDALVYENKFHAQAYEAALSNSYYGDSVFKLRVGPRVKGQESTVIIEDITPKIYFPEINQFNVRATPERHVLAWTFKINGETYLRKEIHEVGKIINEVWKMNGEEIAEKASLDILGIEGLQEEVETGIDRSLIVHIPNWKTGNRYFGISDYFDLDTLFYAINNRMTKTDNILDKHSDPILMLPEGILDENGSVKRSKLNMIEMPSGENGAKPEYVVWNASLENAFKEVEKLVEFFYMVSETSPDVLGMGQGQSDSGRALKLKVMRTLAKAARKKLYLDSGFKEVLYVAQLLAKKHNLKVGGVKLSGEPVVPELEWGDGLPIDNSEQAETERVRLDAGNTSVADSIMRLDGVDEATAKKKAKEIKDENAVPLVESGLGKNMDGKSMDTPPVKPAVK